MTKTIAHILGPGGAGKSTVGTLLSTNFGIPVVDLDIYFIENVGDISHFIGTHGYIAYARKNVLNYRTIVERSLDPTVVVLSSGFMTYPSDLDASYSELVTAISRHPLSALLLPSFETEECVALIVHRQMQRSYLHCNRDREEARIRYRLPMFMDFQCKRFLSTTSPAELAFEVGAFVTANKRFKSIASLTGITFRGPLT
jgi:hypothetical protein